MTCVEKGYVWIFMSKAPVFRCNGGREVWWKKTSVFGMRIWYKIVFWINFVMWKGG